MEDSSCVVAGGVPVLRDTIEPGARKSCSNFIKPVNSLAQSVVIFRLRFVHRFRQTVCTAVQAE